MDTQTDISTYRIIGPEGRCFEKQEEGAIDKHYQESTVKKHAEELLGWEVSKTAI